MRRSSRPPRGSTRPDSTARRAARRSELLDAAIAVVRREGPGASMDAIAREAGVTKPIVYRAFGDREGLTNAVAERFASELASALGDAISSAPSDRERVAQTIDTYLRFIESDPAIVRFLIHRGIERSAEQAVAMSAFVAHVGQLITRAIGEAMRARGLDSGPAEPWAYAIVGAVHLAGDWWLERKVLPRERLVDYLTALVWDGMQSFSTPREGHADGADVDSLDVKTTDLKGRTV